MRYFFNKMIYILPFTFFLGSLHGGERIPSSFQGEIVALDEDTEAQMREMQQELEALFGFASDELAFFGHDHEYLAEAGSQSYARVAKGLSRDYYTPIKSNEERDISYIVKTLAYKPVTKIWKYKGSLQTTGGRLTHLHPLNFLYCIFGDEELKVGIRNIRKRGWIWGDFFASLKNTLKEEASKNNILPEHIEDFSSKLHIDSGLITAFFEKQEWLELVDKLIEIVPREGDVDRYGM